MCVCVCVCVCVRPSAAALRYKVTIFGMKLLQVRFLCTSKSFFRNLTPESYMGQKGGNVSGTRYPAVVGSIPGGVTFLQNIFLKLYVTYIL